MNRLFLLLGFSFLWSGAAVAQDLIFEDGFENHPDAVEVLSFSASPNPVVVGNPTTLAWTIKDADSCTPTDGNAAWQALNINPAVANGSFEVTGLTEGPHTFTLTCTGPIGDPAVAAVQIQVDAAPPVCEDPDLTGETITWAEFWQDEFPDINLGVKPNGDPRDSRELQIFVTGYRAISFDTGNVSDTGLFESPDNIFVSGERVGVLSKCVGRFDNVPAACKFVWDTNSGGITWSTEGTLGACQLEANTTYYLNVTFTDGVDPDSTTCGVGEDCFATIKHTLNP